MQKGSVQGGDACTFRHDHRGNAPTRLKPKSHMWEKAKNAAESQRTPTKVGCGMECVCATLGRSSICTRCPWAKRGKPRAAAFELSACAAGEKCDGPRFESGVIKNVSWQTSFNRVLSNWWHQARQCRLEQLGKTNGLLGAWTDPELLALSRSLKSWDSRKEFTISCSSLI